MSEHIMLPLFLYDSAPIYIYFSSLIYDISFEAYFFSYEIVFIYDIYIGW